MKQIFIKLGMIAVGFTLLAACSKENNDNDTESKEQTQYLVFSMNEAPYNDEVEMAGTRGNATEIIKDTLLLNGVEAEVTLERDKEQLQQPATRAITSENHYTIVAFKTGTSTEVASTKGYFDATGVFKYDIGSGMMKIPACSYDFVCYTHQYVTRTGNTITITQANADKAFVARQMITIYNTKRQEVAFTMKHVGARIRTKLMALMTPTDVNGTLGYQVGKVPASIDYDMTTGNIVASTTKNNTAQSETQSYDQTGNFYDTAIQENLSTVTGDKYLTVLAGTKPEELVYSITGGTVYNATLNTKGFRNLKAGNAFEANGAYTLTIKLMPRYLYLFEDGKTGGLNEGDRKNHIPIAIVFDAIGKRAISLWDANGGAGTKWYGESDYNRQHNDVMYNNPSTALQSAAAQGKHWTWDASGSKDGKIKANEQSKYPAFYYAGKFYNSTDLTNRLNGKTLATVLNRDEVWYLPSWYEWKEVFVRLGFGDGSKVVKHGGWQWKNRNLINNAFTAANGTSIASNNYTEYGSSSERDPSASFCIAGFNWGMHFIANGKDQGETQKVHVRPFVAYE